MNRKLGEEAILDSWRYPLLFTVQKTPPSCLPFFHTKNSLPHYYAVSVCCVWSLLEVAFFFFSYSVLVNFKRRTVVLYTCQLFITWNAHMDGFQIKLPVFQTCVFCYLSFSRIMSKAVFLSFYFTYFLLFIPPQKIFVSPGTTILTSIQIQQHRGNPVHLLFSLFRRQVTLLLTVEQNWFKNQSSFKYLLFGVMIAVLKPSFLPPLTISSHISVDK